MDNTADPVTKTYNEFIQKVNQIMRDFLQNVTKIREQEDEKRLKELDSYMKEKYSK